MKRRYVQDECPKRPVKAVIFGDNAFSRGVWGRIFKEINKNEPVNCVMVRDNPAGDTERADNRYVLVLKGENGDKHGEIDFVEAVVDGYTDFDSFSSLADEKEITTLLWSPEENSWTLKNGKLKNEKHNPLAQITMLLFRRFCLEMRGFTVVSAFDEDYNGDRLKEDIIKYASLRGLGMDFINWLNFENRFVNTVVQNLPQGTKREEMLYVYAENYMLFVADSDAGIIDSCVKHVEDIGEYYTMKRHIYGGALASSCAYALLHGVETLSGFMVRQKLAKHMSVAVFEEIIPSVHVNFETVQAYTMEMFDRFSSSANVVSWKKEAQNLAGKVAESIVPIISEYMRINEKSPKHLVFAIFCTIEYYRSFDVNDNFAELFDKDTAEILKDKRIWGSDLSFLLPEITAYEEKMQ